MPKTQLAPANGRGGKSTETENRRLGAKTMQAYEVPHVKIEVMNDEMAN